jgi:uncharacterized repeat protein (TIGR02543 family)
VAFLLVFVMLGSHTIDSVFAFGAPMTPTITQDIFENILEWESQPEFAAAESPPQIPPEFVAEIPPEFAPIEAEIELEVEIAPFEDMPIDDPIIDDPVVDDPIVDDPIVDDPIIDDPTTDDPTTDDPTTDDPTGDPIDDPIIDEDEDKDEEDTYDPPATYPPVEETPPTLPPALPGAGLALYPEFIDFGSIEAGDAQQTLTVIGDALEYSFGLSLHIVNPQLDGEPAEAGFVLPPQAEFFYIEAGGHAEFELSLSEYILPGLNTAAIELRQYGELIAMANITAEILPPATPPSEERELALYPEFIDFGSIEAGFDPNEIAPQIIAVLGGAPENNYGLSLHIVNPQLDGEALIIPDYVDFDYQPFTLPQNATLFDIEAGGQIEFELAISEYIFPGINTATIELRQDGEIVGTTEVVAEITPIGIVPYRDIPVTLGASTGQTDNFFLQHSGMWVWEVLNWDHINTFLNNQNTSGVHLTVNGNGQTGAVINIPAGRTLTVTGNQLLIVNSVTGFNVHGTLNLTGGTITRESIGAWHENRVFTVHNNGRVNMTGGILQNSGTGFSRAFHIEAGGRFDMTGGTIRNFFTNIYLSQVNGVFNMSGSAVIESTQSSQAAVRVFGNGEFHMWGNAHIRNIRHRGRAVDSQGRFTMNGNARITGIEAFDGSSVRITGGTAELLAGWTGHISGNVHHGLVIQGGTVDMRNGSIHSNNNSGVVVSGGTFNMHGGSINSNTSTGNGGGIRRTGGTFTISGGEIVGNTAEFGGGIHISGTAATSPQQTGGTIRNNHARNDGGGVAVANGWFDMRGGNIHSNTAARDGAGIALIGGNLNANFNTIAEIHENIANRHGGGIFVGAGSEARLGGDHHDRRTDLWRNTALRGGGVAVNGGTLTMNNNTIIQQNRGTDGGAGVYLSGGGSFTMSNGIIRNNTAATTAGANRQGGGVRISHGTFAMNNGQIHNNTASDGGGVYSEGNGNNLFTMRLGSIHNNTAYGWGGGVDMRSGRFDLHSQGGTPRIEGNSSLSGQGGGIRIDNNAGFNINGAAQISGNRAISANPEGGGIWIHATGPAVTINQTSGEISGNWVSTDANHNHGNANGNGNGGGIWSGRTLTITTARVNNNRARDGGGIFINNGAGNFAMNGGTVNNNQLRATMTGQGAGIFLGTGNSATIQSTVITGNSAPQGGSLGGGIRSHRALTLRAGADIHTNNLGGTSPAGGSQGAGIAMANGANFRNEGGHINNNVLGGTHNANGQIVGGQAAGAGDGGGLWLGNGIHAMTGGQIDRNSASNGGGVMLSGNANFTVSGGQINGNVARSAASWAGGGAIRSVAGTTLTVSGGQINNNHGHDGGGIHALGAVTVSGNVQINSNTANFTGGGIVARGAFTMSGGTIDGNTAGSNAGGIFLSALAGVTSQINGGTISNNRAGIVGGTGLQHGGGIFTERALNLHGTITLNNNHATRGSGGGLFINTGITVDLWGDWSARPGSTGNANFLNNTAGEHGGAIALNNVANARLNVRQNATIRSNRATLDGGGIAVLPGNATRVVDFMTGGTAGHQQVFDNTARNGAGIALYGTGTTFYLRQGDIGWHNGLGTTGQPFNRATGDGGGIFIQGGTATLSGGNIHGNTAGGSGGGLFVNGGTITLSNTNIGYAGGNVGNNAAARGNANLGGGIALVNGTINMSGGNIRNNIANQGGGVHISGGTFNLSGGNIGDHLALNHTNVDLSNRTNSGDNNHGGGVHMTGGTFSMTSGSILHNRTNGGMGGGVHMTGGNFTMDVTEAGNSIRNNTASGGNSGGGGVNVVGGTFTLTRGHIHNNSAGGQGGGGVRIAGGTHSIGAGHTSGVWADIHNNQSSHGGGLAIVGSGTVVNMNSGVVRENNLTANTQGAGVRITDGATLHMIGNSQIRNNGAAPSNITTGVGMNGTGGGLWIGNATVNMQGTSEVRNNFAWQGGGVWMDPGARLNMGADGQTYAVNINNNRAHTRGGGVWVQGGNSMAGGSNHPVLTMRSGQINNNRVNNDSAGVYLAPGSNGAWGGHFIMHGGELRGNQAEQWGAAVRVDNTTVATQRARFNMLGGTIVGHNTGWATIVVHGDMEMRGNAIVENNNTNQNSGFDVGNGVGRRTNDGAAAVHIGANGDFIMNSATAYIRNNQNHHSHGGGLDVQVNAFITLTAGNITGNTAQTHGGGISWNPANFNYATSTIANFREIANGVNISGNTANGGTLVSYPMWEMLHANNGGPINTPIGVNLFDNNNIRSQAQFFLYVHPGHDGNVTVRTQRVNDQGGVIAGQFDDTIIRGTDPEGQRRAIVMHDRQVDIIFAGRPATADHLGFRWARPATWTSEAGALGHTATANLTNTPGVGDNVSYRITNFPANGVTFTGAWNEQFRAVINPDDGQTPSGATYHIAGERIQLRTQQRYPAEDWYFIGWNFLEGGGDDIHPLQSYQPGSNEDSSWDGTYSVDFLMPARNISVRGMWRADVASVNIRNAFHNLPNDATLPLDKSREHWGLITEQRHWVGTGAATFVDPNQPPNGNPTMQATLGVDDLNINAGWRRGHTFAGWHFEHNNTRIRGTDGQPRLVTYADFGISSAAVAEGSTTGQITMRLPTAVHGSTDTGGGLMSHVFVDESNTVIVPPGPILTARWTRNTYNVIVANFGPTAGSTNNERTGILYGQRTSFFDAGVRPGWNFTGWTVTAGWAFNNDSWGSVDGNEVRGHHPHPVPLENHPGRMQVEIFGGNQQNNVSQGSRNITFTAQWERSAHVVTVHEYGGTRTIPAQFGTTVSFSPEATMEVGEEIIQLQPPAGVINERIHFHRWESLTDGVDVRNLDFRRAQIASMPNQPVEVIARWLGLIAEPDNVDFGEVILRPDAPPTVGIGGFSATMLDITPMNVQIPPGRFDTVNLHFGNIEVGFSDEGYLRTRTMRLTSLGNRDIPEGGLMFRHGGQIRTFYEGNVEPGTGGTPLSHIDIGNFRIFRNEEILAGTSYDLRVQARTFTEPGHVSTGNIEIFQYFNQYNSAGVLASRWDGALAILVATANIVPLEEFGVHYNAQMDGGTVVAWLGSRGDMANDGNRILPGTSVTVDGTRVNVGATIVTVAEPARGFHVYSWNARNTSEEAITDAPDITSAQPNNQEVVRTFTIGAGGLVLNVVFEPNPHRFEVSIPTMNSTIRGGDFRLYVDDAMVHTSVGTAAGATTHYRNVTVGQNITIQAVVEPFAEVRRWYVDDVVVRVDEDGELIFGSTNPEYGYFRGDSLTMTAIDEPREVELQFIYISHGVIISNSPNYEPDPERPGEVRPPHISGAEIRGGTYFGEDTTVNAGSREGHVFSHWNHEAWMLALGEQIHPDSDRLQQRELRFNMPNQSVELTANWVRFVNESINRSELVHINARPETNEGQNYYDFSCLCGNLNVLHFGQAVEGYSEADRDNFHVRTFTIRNYHGVNLTRPLNAAVGSHVNTPPLMLDIVGIDNQPVSGGARFEIVSIWLVNFGGTERNDITAHFNSTGRIEPFAPGYSVEITIAAPHGLTNANMNEPTTGEFDARNPMIPADGDQRRYRELLRFTGMDGYDTDGTTLWHVRLDMNVRNLRDFDFVVNVTHLNDAPESDVQFSIDGGNDWITLADLNEDGVREDVSELIMRVLAAYGTEISEDGFSVNGHTVEILFHGINTDYGEPRREYRFTWTDGLEGEYVPYTPEDPTDPYPDPDPGAGFGFGGFMPLSAITDGEGRWVVQVDVEIFAAEQTLDVWHVVPLLEDGDRNIYHQTSLELPFNIETWDFPQVWPFAPGDFVFENNADLRDLEFRPYSFVLRTYAQPGPRVEQASGIFRQDDLWWNVTQVSANIIDLTDITENRHIRTLGGGVVGDELEYELVLLNEEGNPIPNNIFTFAFVGMDNEDPITHVPEGGQFRIIVGLVDGTIPWGDHIANLDITFDTTEIGFALIYRNPDPTPTPGIAGFAAASMPALLQGLVNFRMPGEHAVLEIHYAPSLRFTVANARHGAMLGTPVSSINEIGTDFEAFSPSMRRGQTETFSIRGPLPLGTNSADPATYNLPLWDIILPEDWHEDGSGIHAERLEEIIVSQERIGELNEEHYWRVVIQVPEDTPATISEIVIAPDWGDNNLTIEHMRRYGGELEHLADSPEMVGVVNNAVVRIWDRPWQDGDDPPTDLDFFPRQTDGILDDTDELYAHNFMGWTVRNNTTDEPITPTQGTGDYRYFAMPANNDATITAEYSRALYTVNLYRFRLRADWDAEADPNHAEDFLIEDGSGLTHQTFTMAYNDTQNLNALEFGTTTPIPPYGYRFAGWTKLNPLTETNWEIVPPHPLPGESLPDGVITIPNTASPHLAVLELPFPARGFDLTAVFRPIEHNMTIQHFMQRDADLVNLQPFHTDPALAREFGTAINEVIAVPNPPAADAGSNLIFVRMIVPGMGDAGADLVITDERLLTGFDMPNSALTVRVFWTVLEDEITIEPPIDPELPPGPGPEEGGQFDGLRIIPNPVNLGSAFGTYILSDHQRDFRIENLTNRERHLRLIIQAGNTGSQPFRLQNPPWALPSGDLTQIDITVPAGTFIGDDLQEPGVETLNLSAIADLPLGFYMRRVHVLETTDGGNTFTDTEGDPMDFETSESFIWVYFEVNPDTTDPEIVDPEVPPGPDIGSLPNRNLGRGELGVYQAINHNEDVIVHNTSGREISLRFVIEEGIGLDPAVPFRLRADEFGTDNYAQFIELTIPADPTDNSATFNVSAFEGLPVQGYQRRVWMYMPVPGQPGEWERVSDNSFFWVFFEVYEVILEESDVIVRNRGADNDNPVGMTIDADISWVAPLFAAFNVVVYSTEDIIEEDITEGSTVTVTLGEAVDGWAFKEWVLPSDLGENNDQTLVLEVGTIYDEVITFTMPAEPVTLTALWVDLTGGGLDPGPNEIDPVIWLYPGNIVFETAEEILYAEQNEDAHVRSTHTQEIDRLNLRIVDITHNGVAFAGTVFTTPSEQFDIEAFDDTGGDTFEEVLRAITLVSGLAHGVYVGYVELFHGDVSLVSRAEDRIRLEFTATPFEPPTIPVLPPVPPIVDPGGPWQPPSENLGDIDLGVGTVGRYLPENHRWDGEEGRITGQTPGAAIAVNITENDAPSWTPVVRLYDISDIEITDGQVPANGQFRVAIEAPAGLGIERYAGRVQIQVDGTEVFNYTVSFRVVELMYSVVVIDAPNHTITAPHIPQFGYEPGVSITVDAGDAPTGFRFDGWRLQVNFDPVNSLEQNIGIGPGGSWGSVNLGNESITFEMPYGNVWLWATWIPDEDGGGWIPPEPPPVPPGVTRLDLGEGVFGVYDADDHIESVRIRAVADTSGIVVSGLNSNYFAYEIEEDGGYVYLRVRPASDDLRVGYYFSTFTITGENLLISGGEVVFRVISAPSQPWFLVVLENVGDNAQIGLQGALGPYNPPHPFIAGLENVEVNAGTRPDFEFAGWTVSTNPNTPAFSVADTANINFLMPSHHVTLTANWDASEIDPPWPPIIEPPWPPTLPPSANEQVDLGIGLVSQYGANIEDDHTQTRPLADAASVEIDDTGAGWLSFEYIGNHSIVFRPIDGNLPVGNYEATVTATFDDNSMHIFHVIFKVEDRAWPPPPIPGQDRVDLGRGIVGRYTINAHRESRMLFGAAQPMRIEVDIPGHVDWLDVVLRDASHIPMDVIPANGALFIDFMPSRTDLAVGQYRTTVQVRFVDTGAVYWTFDVVFEVVALQYGVTLVNHGLGAVYSVLDGNTPIITNRPYSGTFGVEPGNNVGITAGTRVGYLFTGWESQEISITSSAATITFVMPSEPVEITGTWATDEDEITPEIVPPHTGPDIDLGYAQEGYSDVLVRDNNYGVFRLENTLGVAIDNLAVDAGANFILRGWIIATADADELPPQPEDDGTWPLPPGASEFAGTIPAGQTAVFRIWPVVGLLANHSTTPVSNQAYTAQVDITRNNGEPINPFNVTFTVTPPEEEHLVTLIVVPNDPDAATTDSPFARVEMELDPLVEQGTVQTIRPNVSSPAGNERFLFHDYLEHETPEPTGVARPQQRWHSHFWFVRDWAQNPAANPVMAGVPSQWYRFTMPEEDVTITAQLGRFYHVYVLDRPGQPDGSVQFFWNGHTVDERRIEAGSRDNHRFDGWTLHEVTHRPDNFTENNAGDVMPVVAPAEINIEDVPGAYMTHGPYGRNIYFTWPALRSVALRANWTPFVAMTTVIQGLGSVEIMGGEMAAGLEDVVDGHYAVGGADITGFAVDAGDGYRFDRWYIGDEEQTVDPNDFIMPVTAAAVMRFVFLPVAGSETVVTYSVEGGPGSISTIPYVMSGSTVVSGGNIAFTVTPGANHRLLRWEVNGVAAPETGNTITRAAVSGSLNVVAVLISTHAVTFASSPASGGSVTNNLGIASGSRVDNNTSITFTATANTGYRFLGWRVDNTLITGATLQRTITNDLNVIAEFVRQHRVTFYAIGQGSVAADVVYGAFVDPNTDVSFTATANTGHRLAHWLVNGTQVAASENPLEWTVTADLDVVAVFEPIPPGQHVVTFVASPASGGTVAASNGMASGGTVVNGTTLTFTATANSGYRLTGWTVNGTSVAAVGNTLTRVVTANLNVVAVFERIMHVVTFSASPASGGTVSVSNGMISGGTVPNGTTLTFTTTTNTGYRFLGWRVNNAAVLITGASLQRTVTSDLNVVAEFVRQHTVTFSHQGQGVLTATVENGALVDHNTPVTFTATANTGHMLAHWMVNNVRVEPGENPLTRVVTANLNVVAVFELIPPGQYVVIFSANPDTGGTISVSNDMASGGTVVNGTILTFEAEANTGYRFLGWRVNNAAELVEGASLQRTITANLEVVAEFERIMHTVTFAASPANTGSVSVFPNMTSGETVAHGEILDFTATPSVGFVFLGWRINNAATLVGGTTQQRTVTDDLSMVAVFEEIPIIPGIQYRVTFGVTPDGLGSVSASSFVGPVVSGQMVNSGTVITFAVAPNGDNTFAGWRVNGGWMRSPEGSNVVQWAITGDTHIDFHLAQPQQSLVMLSVRGADSTARYNFDGTTIATVTGETIPRDQLEAIESWGDDFIWTVHGRGRAVRFNFRFEEVLSAVAAFDGSTPDISPFNANLYEFVRWEINDVDWLEMERRGEIFDRGGYSPTSFIKFIDNVHVHAVAVIRRIDGPGEGGNGGNGATEPPAIVRPERPEPIDLPEVLEPELHALYVLGFPDGTVQADGFTTRAQMAQLFFNLSEHPYKRNFRFDGFSDVGADGWYFTAISYFAVQEILIGDPGGTFRPNDYITNAEFATFVSRLFNLAEIVVGNGFVPGTEQHWAAGYIKLAFDTGWFAYFGEDFEFDPDAPIIRAQAITLINHFTGRIPNSYYIDAYLGDRMLFSDINRAHRAFYDIMEAAIDHMFTREDGVETWHFEN